MKNFDLCLLIRRTRTILWNLFLLVGNFYKYFVTEIRNKTNQNRKKRQFLRNLLLRLIIRQCFAEFIFADNQKQQHFAEFIFAF